MIVICLEGCHGCGKTSLTKEFQTEFNLPVLDEAFLDMPEGSLHPQSLLMETAWVCSWYQRVLRIANKHKKQHQNNADEDSHEAVYIADRSPYSAVFYAKHGHLLDPIIRQQQKEVFEGAGIEIFTVHVQVEKELLWSRIKSRLEVEPNRILYNEHKREWMETTLEFYNNYNWDMSVNNNEEAVKVVANAIVSLLNERSLSFKKSFSRKLSIDNSSVATDSDCDSCETLDDCIE